MDTRQTALVIGAGLGGIATAARLARNGYDVTVLEKNPTPGGRCGQLIRDGHRFDIGPTLFLMPEIFTETYTDLGERMEDHLDLQRIDPTYRFHYIDGTQLDLTADLIAMQPQLEAIEPGSFGGLLRYMVEGRQNYKLSLKHLVGRNYFNFLEYFSPKNLPLFFKLKALVKHYDHIGNYFQHPNLKAAFTFQDLYLGTSPLEAPATYSLLQYTEFADGVWFPIGGLYRLVESLVSIARANGVRFRYNTPVKRIEVSKDHATGVVMQDGSRLHASVIVANADLPYVYNQLLPDNGYTERLERMKYTCSALMFYWGVDKVYPQLKHHNIFMAGDYRSSFDSIFSDYSLPDEPSFYVHAPARTDPSAAPEDQDTLMVLMPVGRLEDSANQDWKALRACSRSAVIQRLSEIGVRDLKEHIKFEVSFTPNTWQSMFNVAKGAPFGSLSHNLSQVGFLRPKNRHPHYRNLYFAGGSTHLGSGLPLVLMSARLTTDRIFKEAGELDWSSMPKKYPMRAMFEEADGN